MNIAIIGAGPGGYVAALHAAHKGAKVTLIENSYAGGTCLNKGCIPTKSLVTASQLMRELGHADRFGINVGNNISYDWSKVIGRMNSVSSTMRKGVEALIANRKIEFIQASASFLNDKTLQLDSGGELTPDNIIIATGSVPIKPNHLEFDGMQIATSDDFLQWQSLPDDICIIGEGIISCELAFILESFGVKVTIIGMEEKPLPTLDHDVSSVIQREMRKRKIKFIGKTKVQQLKRSEQGITVIGENDSMIAESERVLVCIGRMANTAKCNLSNTTIKMSEKGSILVDRQCRTSVSNIFAIGDVNANCMLAHSAAREGKMAINAILGINDEGIDYGIIPWSIFTSPEVAVVGKSEAKAVQDGFDIKTGSFDIRGIGKAQVQGELSGIVKVVIDRKTACVLGVHIVGPHATELIQHAGLAVKQGLKLEQLLEQVYSHPTISEGVQEAFEDAHDQAIHKLLKT